MQALYLVGTREFSRDLSGSLQFGVLRADRAGDNVTDLGLEARLDREIEEAGTLSIGVRQAVSSGLGSGGATLDRGGYIAWTRTWRGVVAAVVNLAYWDRESLDLPGVGDLSSSTIVSSESVRWSATRRLSIGLTHRYSDQDVSSGTELTAATQDANYHSGGVFIRWDFNPPREQP